MIFGYGLNMGSPRGTHSRGLELVAMAVNANSGMPLAEINRTLAKFKQNLRGGKHVVAEGATLVWGDIRSLKDDLSSVPSSDLQSVLQRYGLPRLTPPKLIFHMDHVGLPLLRKYGVSLRRKGKADVLIVEDDALRSLSIKDPTREAKLGQQSRSKTYQFTSGGVNLAGGFNLERLAEERDEILKGLDLSYKLTALDAQEQKRLNESNRLYAIAKHQRPVAWKALIENAEAEAEEELSAFLIHGFQGTEAAHANNLSVLLAELLIEKSAEGLEEWISSEYGPVRLDHALKHLSERKDVQVTCAPCTCKTGGRERGKSAWEIRASVLGNMYLVARIQPSFEGGGIGVEQTKGIVYHFQEAQPHRAKGERSVWGLLADLSATPDK
jgi:hypothetical protein